MTQPIRSFDVIISIRDHSGGNVANGFKDDEKVTGVRLSVTLVCALACGSKVRFAFSLLYLQFRPSASEMDYEYGHPLRGFGARILNLLKLRKL
jgi:hypothetical protein